MSDLKGIEYKLFEAGVTTTPKIRYRNCRNRCRTNWIRKTRQFWN